MYKKRWLNLLLYILLIFSFNPIQAEIIEPDISAGAAILIDANTKTVLFLF